MFNLQLTENELYEVRRLLDLEHVKQQQKLRHLEVVGENYQERKEDVENLKKNLRQEVARLANIIRKTDDLAIADRGQHRESKTWICGRLLDLLQHTRAGEDIETADYKNRFGEETVTLCYKDGSKTEVNVNMDSGIALMRDVLKEIH